MLNYNNVGIPQQFFFTGLYWTSWDGAEYKMTEADRSMLIGHRRTKRTEPDHRIMNNHRC